MVLEAGTEREGEVLAPLHQSLVPPHPPPTEGSQSQISLYLKASRCASVVPATLTRYFCQSVKKKLRPVIGLGPDFVRWYVHYDMTSDAAMRIKTLSP